MLTCSVDEISDFDPYDAVVFGSGGYDGSWTAAATDLVRRHTAVLARKPVRLLFKALGGHTGDNRQWPDIDSREAVQL